MIVNKKKTDEVKARKDKSKKVKVQKYVSIRVSSGKINVKSPHQGTIIEGGWLKAAYNNPEFRHNGTELYGGAIHAYRDKQKLSFQYVLQCWAYLEDFIAWGDIDIAFSKIWVPIEEVERVIKQYKKDAGIK